MLALLDVDTIAEVDEALMNAAEHLRVPIRTADPDATPNATPDPNAPPAPPPMSRQDVLDFIDALLDHRFALMASSC